jgi:hypothetical protein
VRGFERLLVDCSQYLFQNTIDVSQHVVSPKPQDKIATYFEIVSSAQILFGLIGVLAAIKFDHKLGVRAAEVDDKSIERHLSPKLQATKPGIAQLEPQITFGISLIPAQATRDLDS